MRLEVNPNGGWTRYTFVSTAAVLTAQVVAKPGKLGPFHFHNTDTIPLNVRFYDKASAPTLNSDAPIDRVLVPAGTSVSFGGSGTEGISFETGLWIYASGGIGDTDTTALSANKAVGGVRYFPRESGYSGS